MFNPRPECTRYNDNTPKRNIHLADRALASTQNMNIQQMNTTNFTMGEKSYSLSNPTFIDRGGINTRTLKSVNNIQTNNYYQMGRIGAEASTMMDLTRPMDTRLQYNDKRQNTRVPMSKAVPKNF
jgi:hypothetical protein